MNLNGMLSGVFSPLVSFLFLFLKVVLGSAFLVTFGFFASFFVLYKLNPFKFTLRRLKRLKVKWKYHDLFRWKLVDYIERRRHKGEFKEYGFTFFVGRQGSGKTISMVDYLRRMKERHPNCMIVTNFKCKYSDFIMCDWRDLLEVRNGTDGTIFAIDEIQSEYSASAWKDVPESLLSEISQQRKQRVKIVATAQYFCRVAKPLREQACAVVACSTWLGRLTRNVLYDSVDYSMVIDNPNVVKRKVRPLSKISFVQSDFLRHCYDTYEKIERMRKIDFIPRNQRGTNA